jgi:hypothetical protein
MLLTDKEQVLEKPKNHSLSIVVLKQSNCKASLRRKVDRVFDDRRDNKCKEPLDWEGAETCKFANFWMKKDRIHRYSEVQRQNTRLSTHVHRRRIVREKTHHTHERILHLGTGNTMAAIRDEWWIPRSKVKNILNTCIICKVCRAKPYRPANTAAGPTFRTEGGRPFQTTVELRDPWGMRFWRMNWVNVTN